MAEKEKWELELVVERQDENGISELVSYTSGMEIPITWKRFFIPLTNFVETNIGKCVFLIIERKGVQ